MIKSVSNEDLCRRYQAQDPDAGAELCRQNTGLIRSVAGSLSRYAEPADLMQEGYAALLEAAGRFDPKQEAKFSTYAWKCIRLSLMRYLNNNRAVHIPVYIQHELFNADPDDLPEDLQRVRLALSPVSMDTPIEEAFTVADLIPDPARDMEGVEDRVQNEELAAVLWGMVDELLKPEQAAVIRARYQQDLTLKETGEAVGLSTDRARTLHDRGIRKLRTRDYKLRPYLDDERAYQLGLQGTSWTAYKYTGTSSTERAVLKAEEHDERKKFFWPDD